MVRPLEPIRAQTPTHAPMRSVAAVRQKAVRDGDHRNPPFQPYQARASLWLRVPIYSCSALPTGTTGFLQLSCAGTRHSFETPCQSHVYAAEYC